MGTRSGDVDPALIGHLARTEEVPVAEVERWLNERVRAARPLGPEPRHAGPARARARAIRGRGWRWRSSAHRARKYLGAYLAVLGGADAVVFSGGIGEHAPEVRARICAGMEWCGLVLDAERNAAAVGREARVTLTGPASPPM